MALGAVGLACESIIAALLVLARLLEGVAKLTPTKTDDRIIAAAIRKLEAAAEYIPRLRLGGKARRDERGEALLVTLIAAGIAAGSMGCGASPERVVRFAAVGAAEAVVAVDPIVARAYDALAEDCAAGREDCAEALRRLDRAERGLASLERALRAVDYAVQAAEAGQKCGLRPAVSAALDASRELVEALEAAGLSIPPPVPLAVAGLAALMGSVPGECVEAVS